MTDLPDVVHLLSEIHEFRIIFVSETYLRRHLGQQLLHV